MSKTIKVSEATWQSLDDFRKKGDTFDDVIVWLLKVAEAAEAFAVIGKAKEEAKL